MRSGFGRSRLGGGNFDSDEADPMAGVSNMSDAMLVLAVGIMMALIINWNIDVNPQASMNMVDTEQLTEVEDYDSLDGNQLETGDGMEGLEEKGVVYMDPETGKIYLIVDEE